MSGTSRRFFFASALALCVGLLGLNTTARAASINYGSFNVPAPPASVAFLNVTESSGTDPVPLYGAPDPFAIGLDFDPTTFTANSQNGGADFTDGQLNFTVMGNTFPPQGVIAIDSIQLDEAGDYSLVGPGGAATQVLAGAIVFATVTGIDGVAVAPISLPAVNASFSNSLSGPDVTAPWSLGLIVDVAGQLASMGVPFIVGATKVEIVVDNALYAQGEAGRNGQPGSTAFITKSDFRITIEDHPGQTPEPASASLALLALAGLARGARKKSQAS